MASGPGAPTSPEKVSKKSEKSRKSLENVRERLLLDFLGPPERETFSDFPRDAPVLKILRRVNFGTGS